LGAAVDVKRSGQLKLVACLLAPPVAWYAFQQGLAVTLRTACDAAGAPAGTIWGVLSLLVCGAAGWLSRRSGLDGESARFVGYVAQLGAGLFALAISFQSLATMIVPPCAR
jgi:hypothetical protein